MTNALCIAGMAALLTAYAAAATSAARHQAAVSETPAVRLVHATATKCRARDTIQRRDRKIASTAKLALNCSQ